MNSNSKRILMFVVLLSVLFLAIQNIGSNSNNIFKQAQIRLDKDNKTPLEIRFTKNQRISIQTFFDEYKRTYHLSDDYEFKPFKVFTDQLGQIHHRYKQYYKGIELTEVQYLIHEENGSVFYAHGKFIHDLDIDVNPAISEKEALTKALNHINAEVYMWENQKGKNLSKQLNKYFNATNYPKGELKISAGLKEKIAKNFKLVYRFDIFSQKPLGRYDVDVDAKTGEIVGVLSRLHSGDVQGYGTTLYNGNVQITVSDTNFYIPPDPPAHFHLDSWSAYGNSGDSWWMADPGLGTYGGYDDSWYEILDTDPIYLTGSGYNLKFFHRYFIEPPAGATAPYDGWDGMNVRISTDNGISWQVLANPVPAYSNSSLYSFGYTHGEGPGLPGWTGQLNNWTEVTFNLDSYSGQTVQFRFAFASDEATSTALNGDPNWFAWQVDNIIVTNSTDTLYYNDGVPAGINASNLIREANIIPGNYRLREAGRVGGIVTFDALNQTALIHSIDFVDNDSNFTDTNVPAGVSVHWATEATYDYYLTKHSRNSYDNNGGRIISYAHFDENLNNAFGGGGYMLFGDGDGLNCNPLVSVDIVSHEFTHSVTQFSADLIYAYESGALNESFSDIFGTAVEFFVDGSNANWLIGADFALVPFYIRSMSNPNDSEAPDTYLGNYWWTDPGDNGGVHTNSGVQNFWFYLLSEGGSGVNDNGDAYSVTGIGIEEAAQIAYRNLTVYLMPSSKYSDARLGSLNSAIDLFGVNSPQYQAVMDSWYAVGVYLPYVGPYAQNCSINASYLAPGIDTLIVNCEAINPNSHSLELNTIIESFDLSISDTISMYDDGFHNDSTAGDGLFGNSWSTIPGERNYRLSITTLSLDSGYYNVLPNAAYFTTIGPLVVDSFFTSTGSFVLNPGDSIMIALMLKNMGIIASAQNVSSYLTSSSPCVKKIISEGAIYGNINPGEVVTMVGAYTLVMNDSCPNVNSIRFDVSIAGNNYPFWSDSIFFDFNPVNTIKESKKYLPLAHSLKQNYPNPFNPKTTIEFTLPKKEYVKLKIYNLLGQEVATLVNEKLNPGIYKYQWDGEQFSSGLYYYRIKTGEYVKSRKLILMK